jgi:2,3-bisphosphoglycerate-dependent phosphoglycerate mutase
MKLYLIRHGHSHVNVDESLWASLSTMDAELTEKGHKQADALGLWMKQNNAQGDVIYCSSMRRARQTAQRVTEALGIEPVYDDRLREIGTNYANGLAIEEELLPRTFIDTWPNVTPFSSRAKDLANVESWMHFRVRLATLVDELAIKHADQTVYLVAHGGVVAGIFDNTFNIGPYRRCAVFTHNTGVTLFEHRISHKHETWQMVFHNSIAHLTDPELW